MNDRSRQNPAYRLTRYAPLALIGGGAPFYIDIEYKTTIIFPIAALRQV